MAATTTRQEAHLPARSLSTLLDQAIRRMWPRRAARELLLDLGERKRWAEVDHEDAIRRLAAWLHDELSLPEVLPPAPPAPVPDLVRTRAMGEALAADPLPGVARWATGLAPAVGATPKTLANAVSRGIRSGRTDHRWLRLLARIQNGDHPAEAWLFHERTPESVTIELASMSARCPHLDTGDAVLVLSLVALWQRRRPVTRARGNRGSIRPRRATPKPVAGLTGTLIAPGQLLHLGRLAEQLGGARGRALLLLTIEAALTEAHLAPHPARGAGATCKGEAWLVGVERTLGGHEGLVEDEARDLIRFRVARMRAWRDGTPLPETHGAAVRHPYVRASLLLQPGGQTSPPPAPVDPSTPGLLMLLPQLRSRGYKVSP